MKEFDYEKEYNEFWRRPDRFGSHSYASLKGLIEELLPSLEGGRVLDVGCGMGLLSKSLLRLGFDAYGVDVSHTIINHLKTEIPERYTQASILALPYPDNHFTNVVCMDLMEHLKEEDVLPALRELTRVCSGTFYFRIATGPDRDRYWHLTVRDRNWWEQNLIDVGMEKHPLYDPVSYRAQAPNASFLMRLVDDVSSSCSESAEDGRSVTDFLQQGFLRERSIEADAAQQAMHEVIKSLPDHAEVAILGKSAGSLDIASMLSYAKHSAKVTMTDTLESLSANPSNFDFVIALEDTSVLDDQYTLIESILSSLNPGGRLWLSAIPSTYDAKPTDGAVDTQKLLEKFGQWCSIEALIGLDKSGSDWALRLDWNEAEVLAQAAEFLVMLQKSSVCSDAPVQSIYYRGVEQENLNPLSSEYAQPWLVREMLFAQHRRAKNHDSALANGLEKSESNNDYAAMLCVKGYQLLAGTSLNSAEILQHSQNISACLDRLPRSGLGLRWHLSLSFLQALFYLALGQSKSAEKWFVTSTTLPAMEYSPSLASKQVWAHFILGLMVCKSDLAQARLHWKAGLVLFDTISKQAGTPFYDNSESPLEGWESDYRVSLNAANACSEGLRLSYQHEQFSLIDHSRLLQKLLSFSRSFELDGGGDLFSLIVLPAFEKTYLKPISTKDKAKQLAEALKDSGINQITLYGAGDMGRWVIYWLKAMQMDVELASIVDQKAFYGELQLAGTPIITLKEALSKDEITVLIASEAYEEEICHALQVASNGRQIKAITLSGNKQFTNGEQV